MTGFFLWLFFPPKVKQDIFVNRMTKKKIEILTVLIYLNCSFTQTIYAQDSRTSCKWNDLYETVECDTKAIKPPEEKDPLGTRTIESIDSGYYRKLLPKENSGHLQKSQVQLEIEKIQEQQFQLLQEALHPQPQTQPLTQQDLQFLTQQHQQPPATNTNQAQLPLPKSNGYIGYHVWQNPLTKNKMLLSSEWKGDTAAQPFDCPLAGTFGCFRFTILPPSPIPFVYMPLYVRAVQSNNPAMDAEAYAKEYSKQNALKDPSRSPLNGQSKYVNGIKIYEEQIPGRDVRITMKNANIIWQAECLTLNLSKKTLSETYNEICSRLASDVLLKTALPQSQ